MKFKALFVATLMIALPRAAAGQNPAPEFSVAAAVREEVAKASGELARHAPERQTGHSPEIAEGMGVIAAALGTQEGSGQTTGAISAGLSTRVLLEGTNGREHGSNAFCTTESRYGDRCGRFDSIGVKYSVENAINDRINAYGDRLKEQGKSEAEIERITATLRQQAKEAIAREMSQYVAAYDANRDLILSRPATRPLTLLEGDARYNMVGVGDEMFTGVEGALRAGVGFSLKDYGENGCDLYFLATGSAEGRAYYKLEEGNSARAAVGLEQGVLCQIANTVTVMASPSVQAGGAIRRNPGGEDARTDWLNYAARVRAVIDGRAYFSAEAVHHPSMSASPSDGSRWSATQISALGDVRVSDDWLLGGTVRYTAWSDEARSLTGNSDLGDLQFEIQASKAF